MEDRGPDINFIFSYMITNINFISDHRWHDREFCSVPVAQINQKHANACADVQSDGIEVYSGIACLEESRYGEKKFFEMVVFS